MLNLSELVEEEVWLLLCIFQWNGLIFLYLSPQTHFYNCTARESFPSFDKKEYRKEPGKMKENEREKFKHKENLNCKK